MVFRTTAQGSPTSVVPKHFLNLGSPLSRLNKQNEKLVPSNLDYDKYINDAVKSSYICNNKEDTKTHPGLRLVDMEQLDTLVTKTLICSTCKLTNTLSITDNAKIGFVSTLSINCSFCNKNEKRIKRNYFRKLKAKANRKVSTKTTKNEEIVETQKSSEWV